MLRGNVRYPLRYLIYMTDTRAIKQQEVATVKDDTAILAVGNDFDERCRTL